MSINDTYQPINCDDYDNLELACQHHLLLQLTFRNGESVKAEAADLFYVKKSNISCTNIMVSTMRFVLMRSEVSVTLK